MARFLNHEACPRCGSRNNLGRYDDGSAWCFGCHYREHATGAPSIYRVGDDEARSAEVQMPEDVGTDFGRACVKWLASYHTDIPTAIRRGLLWSESRQQLIYQLGNVWQARNFSLSAKSKNFTCGNINENNFIYGRLCESDYDVPSNSNISRCNGGRSDSNQLVIVEDPLSALRIASRIDSMPLLGSYLAPKRLNAVVGLYRNLVFWLDSDKYKEARGMERRATMMGLRARTIYTDLDPKCYIDKEIYELLSLVN